MIYRRNAPFDSKLLKASQDADPNALAVVAEEYGLTVGIIEKRLHWFHRTAPQDYRDKVIEKTAANAYTPAGGQRHTEEAKKKISETMTGKKRRPYNKPAKKDPLPPSENRRGPYKKTRDKIPADPNWRPPERDTPAANYWKKWRAKQRASIDQFIVAECIERPKAEISLDQLNDRYVQWAFDADIMPVPASFVGTYLRSLYRHNSKDKKYTLYGITLREEEK